MLRGTVGSTGGELRPTGLRGPVLCLSVIPVGGVELARDASVYTRVFLTHSGCAAVQVCAA